MTTEEKAALVELCQSNISQAKGVLSRLDGIDETLITIRSIRAELRLQEIALAALTAEPVAHLYQWAAYITCEGPQRFTKQIEREAPPEWAIEEGQAKGHQPLYSTQPAPAIPDGWRLVPVEPDAAMRLASKRYKASTKVPTGPGFYRAMIAAAPTP